MAKFWCLAAATLVFMLVLADGAVLCSNSIDSRLAVSEGGAELSKSMVRSSDVVQPISDLNLTIAEKTGRQVGGGLWSSFQSQGLNMKDLVVSGNSVQVVVGTIKATSSYRSLQSLVERFGGKVVDTVSAGNEFFALVVDLPVSVCFSFREAVLNSGLARYVEPNMKVYAVFVPKDPNWAVQWGPQRIQADWAWNITKGSPSVLVAVVDTGIDYSHPDLVANYVPLGYNWVSSNADPRDDFGHGTHCAGIIAACLNNSIGVAGLAQVRIMAEKVLSNQGSGSDTWVAEGIIHATDQGAKVISMSLGAIVGTEVMHDAVKYAYDHGVLLIAAAGNNGNSGILYPAAYQEVVAVSATDQYDNRASWSNFGPKIAVAAPGVGIYSTMPTYHVTMNDGGYSMYYSNMSGTSMATPHAVGVAALIWSAYPNATRDWVKERLECAADDIGDPGFDVSYGYGRINARKAVVALQDHDLSLFDLKEPRYIQPGDAAEFNVTVINLGLNSEQNVTLDLLVNGTKLDSVSIGYLANWAVETTTLHWNPMIEGSYNVTLSLSPVPGESNAANNVMSIFVPVRHVPAFILFDQTRNADIGGFSVLVKNLTDKGYIVDTYNCIDRYIGNYLPITSDVLAGYNVLVFPLIESTCSYSFDEIMAIRDFVRGGGGLLAIEGYTNDPDLTGFAGIGWNTYYDQAAATIIYHEVTEGVNSVYCYSQTDPLTVVPPAIGLVRGLEVTHARLAVSEISDGRVACLSSIDVTDSGIVQADNDLLINNVVDWLAAIPKREHDLVVRLDVPSYLEPDEASAIEATVTNNGFKNESNAAFLLLIDNATVAEATIPSIAKGANYTLNYSWTAPSTETNCNITAYAPPLPDESFTLNNVNTRLVTVRNPIIKVTLGQQANYTKVYYDACGYPEGRAYSNFTYDHFLDPHEIFINLQSGDETSSSNSAYMVVNTMNGFVEMGTLSGLWYPYWADTNMTLGSTININEWVGIVTGSETLNVRGRTVDSWKVHVQDFYRNEWYYYYDKTSGLLMRMDEDDYPYWANYTLFLSDTQVPIGITKEHDLGVTLDGPWCVRPNDTALVNITIYNVGSNSETNAQLEVFANDTEVVSETLPEFDVGTAYTVTYLWKPVEAGICNLTAYLPCLPNEEELSNNIATNLVHVRVAQVALISENMELGHLTPALASMGVDYDLYSFNKKYLYTKNLNLLANYSAVIFYDIGYNAREITSDEYTALDGYLLQGGNLLVVAGMNAAYDPLLRKVVRAVEPYGVTDTWSQEMYVDDASHPIMNGTYGTFPAGYYLWPLPGGHYQAAVEPDNSQKAVKVAELGSCSWLSAHCAKIIATRGLPGKVVFYNGDLDLDVSWVTQIQAMLKNTLAWFLTSPEGFYRDVAVTNVSPSGTLVNSGDILYVNVTVFNKGDCRENLTVTAYANTTVINQTNVVLTYGNSAVATFAWNTTGVPLGDYIISGSVNQVPGENNTEDNTLTGGVVTIKVFIHDIAVRTVKPFKTMVGRGYALPFNVTVANTGDYAERFNVTLYANATAMTTQIVTNLPPGNAATITLRLNTTGFAYDNYTISSSAQPVPGETNTTDNICSGGCIVVTISGDANGDFRVGLTDLVLLANAYGSKPGDARWNPDADINCNGVVDLADLVILANHYGQHYP